MENIKHTYQILASLFDKDAENSQQLRQQCLLNGTISSFIERLGSLTGDFKRTKVVDADEGMSVDQHGSGGKKSTASKSSKAKKKSKKEVKKGDNLMIEAADLPQFKKGVGYTTGTGTGWDVEAYLELKEAKNSQITQIITILKSCIVGAHDGNKAMLRSLILESALLPALEAALRSGSLLEMAKELDLYLAYLDFVGALSKEEGMFGLLVDIGDAYVPR